LFYTTGYRAELIHLKLNDVGIFRALIKVVGKRNKERLVPVLPVLVEQLLLYRNERALMDIVDEDFFLKKGLKLNESFVYRLINTYFSMVPKR
jgi:integrase/recombinase XerC